MTTDELNSALDLQRTIWHLKGLLEEEALKPCHEDFAKELERYEYFWAVACDTLERKFSKLPPEVARIFKMRYLQGASISAIAKSLYYSQGAIYFLIKR